MQQQLQHKSLFAVKISGSRGSKYNLLCLLWVIWSPVFCISTARAPQISLLSLPGVCCILIGSRGPSALSEDGPTKKQQGLFSETCPARIRWFAGL